MTSAPTRIFLSHPHRYSALAGTLKRALESLQGRKDQLKVLVSEEIPGGTKWVDWIDKNVRGAEIFLLIYPEDREDLGWCNYELGRFYEPGRHVLCLANTHIEPPPTFHQFQGYRADKNGVMAFFLELFVQGTFTKGQPLNAAVARRASPEQGHASACATEVADGFARYRIRETVFERRLVISPAYDEAGKLDADKTEQKGDAEVLMMPGRGAHDPSNWSTLLAYADAAAIQWPRELEQSLDAMGKGEAPPALTPFRQEGSVRVPMVTSVRTVDSRVYEVTLTLLSAEDRRLPWPLPEKMPPDFKYMLRLLRMMAKARWEILEPGLQAAQVVPMSAERCAQVADRVKGEYRLLHQEAEAFLMRSEDVFFGAFESALEQEMKLRSEFWGSKYIALMNLPSSDAKGLVDVLRELLDNNAQFLGIAATQLVHLSERLRRGKTDPGSADGAAAATLRVVQ